MFRFPAEIQKPKIYSAESGIIVMFFHDKIPRLAEFDCLEHAKRFAVNAYRNELTKQGYPLRALKVDDMELEILPLDKYSKIGFKAKF